MKKFLTALFVALCAFTLFGFVACGKKTETPEVTLPVITLSETSIEIVVGEEKLISPTVTEGAKLTLKAGDSSIVTIDGFSIKGVKEGETTVTISVDGYSDITKTIKVVVKAAPVEPTTPVVTPTPVEPTTPVVTPTPVEPTTPQVKLVTEIKVTGKASMEVGETQTLVVAVSPSDADDASYDLLSSDPSVATVDANGLVTAVSKGSATITATAKDGSGVKGTIAITVKDVKPAEPTDIHIVIGDKEYKSGETIELTELDEVKITWKYFPEDKPVQEGVDASISNERYASLDDEGNLKALEPGTVALLVYALYGDVEQTYVIKINEKIFSPESIEVEGVTTISVREELQLKATVVPERADQSVIWSSSNPEIATVSEEGLVKALQAGDVVITVKSAVDETVLKELSFTIGAEEEYNRLLFYVDPSYTNKGEKVTVDGVEYTVGQNLQSNLRDAIKAADAGAKIYVAAGRYEEAIDFCQSVYVIGAGEDSVLAGKITLASELDGFGFENLKFTEGAGIIAPTDGVSYKNFVMKNCHMDKASAGDDATIHLYGTCENFVFEGNKFYMSTYRGIRFENICTNLSVINNEFTTSGTMYDYVRDMGKAGGEFIFEGNSFDFSNQSGVQIANPIDGAHFRFVNNTFKDMSDTSIDIRELSGTFETGVTIEILHNTFDGGANDWGTIRLRTRILSTENDLTADLAHYTVKYNAFLEIDPKNADDPGYYVDRAGSSALLAFVDLDENYAILNGTVWKPNPENAGQVANLFDSLDKTAINWFDNLEDLEAAWANYNKGADLFVDASFTDAELDNTHFNNLRDAVAAAQADMVISLAAGDYTTVLDDDNKILNIDKNLTIVGPNAKLSGTSDQRAAEATIAGTMQLADDVALKLTGITLDGAVKGTTVPSFELSNSVVAEGYRYVLFSGNVKNVKFSGLLVKANTTERFFRTNGTCENLTVTDSIFNSSAMYDWFRTDAALSGDVLFDNNVFNGSLQSALMIMFHGSGNFVITHNSFYDIAKAAVDIRTSNGVACTSTFNISYNLFDNTNVSPSTMWDPIRLRFNLYTADTLTANVNYNAFINWGTESEYYFLENASSQTDISACVNCDYNYFDMITEPTSANFDGLASSWDHAFTTLRAWAIAVGRQIPSVVKINTTTNLIFVGDELQLEYSATDGLEVVWESSDETVATVVDGKVTALKAGTVTIKLSAEGADNDDSLTITVNESLVDEVKVDPTLEADSGNTYKTMESALAAVVEGGKVVLASGTHADKMNITKSITLTGEDGAVVTGAIYLLANNIVIDGLEFTGDARVMFYNYSSYKELQGFVFKNNYVHDTTETTLAWTQTAYGTGVTGENFASYPGFLSLNGSWTWIDNPQILDNTFENLGDTAVYTNCTRSLTVKGNVFNGVKHEGVRLDYASCYGTMVISENVFVDCTMFGVYLRSYAASAGAMDFTLESNYFYHCGFDADASLCTRSQPGAFGTAAHQEASAAVFKVNYNVFEDCAGYINVRGNISDSSTFALTFTLDASYNAFLTSESALICGNLFGSDTTATNFAIGTFNNNFYGTDATTKYTPAATQFEHVVAMDTTTYDTVAALKEALPENAKLGEMPAGLLPLTVAQTIAYANEAIPNKNDTTDAPIKMVGFVSAAPADKGKYYNNVYLVDALGDTTSFLVYTVNKTDAVSAIYENDKVVVEGYLKNYNGTKEMADVNKIYPTLVSVVRGTSSVALAENSSDKATVTGLPESGLNGSTFEFTVTALEGYEVASVKVNGVEIQPADGKYVGTVQGSTVVTVEAYQAGVKAGTETLDISTYATAHWADKANGERFADDQDTETTGYQASFTSEDGNFVVSISATDNNTGKLYGKNADGGTKAATDTTWTSTDLRVYKSGSGTITVTVAEGKTVTLQSVALTFAKGAATVDGNAITSGLGVSVTGNTITFTVTDNIQITKIEFSYTYTE